MNLHTSRKFFIIAFLLLVASTITACKRNGNQCSDNPNILLFTGTGTSPNDVDAIETILNSDSEFNYCTVDAEQLNTMSEAQLRAYRLLIIPGGNFINIGKSLTSNTAANIRNAVHNGLNYLGICAGGFLAGNSSYYNGINLTSGVTFNFYSAENQGIRKAAVPIASPGAPTLEQYWEDGPQFSGWGAVAGRYPNGTPAIAEGTFGNGWIILTGIHAEAPENWRRGMTFNTPASTDNAYAAMLIRAALNRTELPHY